MTQRTSLRRIARAAPALTLAVVAIAALTALTARAASAGGRSRSAATSGIAGILFADSGGGGSDLYVVQPDGTGRTAVTSSPGLAEAQGDWAPDRRHIAFTTWDGRLWRLAVADVVEGGQTTISSGPEDFEPDWSPRATRILFTAYFNRDTPNQTSFIMTSDPDGSNVRPVISLQNAQYYIGNPKWSPDGTQIAFTLGSPGRGGSLYLMSADGTDVRRALEHPGWDDIDPAWSPDGGRLAFASGRYSGSTMATKHDIWLLDIAQGVAGTVIIDEGRDLRRPCWSPDGSQIAFDVRTVTGPSTRYTIHIAPSLGGAVGDPVTIGREPDWAGVAPPTTTPVIITPTPTTDVTGTGTPELTATPPQPATIPPVPTVPPFPTIPTEAPTEPGPAPSFPPPTASATPSPTASATGASPTATASASPTMAVLSQAAYLPLAARNSSVGHHQARPDSLHTSRVHVVGLR